MPPLEDGVHWLLIDAVQIYMPRGAGVWYGRVSAHEVASIVHTTIIGGRILLPLLRGGVNLARPDCKGLNDW